MSEAGNDSPMRCTPHKIRLAAEGHASIRLSSARGNFHEGCGVAADRQAYVKCYVQAGEQLLRSADTWHLANLMRRFARMRHP